MAEQKILNFMGWRRQAAVVSALLIMISIGSLVVKGLNFGLDFTGGTQIEIVYDKAVVLNDVRQALEKGGYEGAIVVHYGSEHDVLVRLAQTYNDKTSEGVITALKQGYEGELHMRRIEFVGPQVGSDLRDQGGLAMIVSLLAVMVYVAFRYQFKFAVGAIVSLTHDVVITLGVFSLFGWNFDLTVLAAILAVIGYSINDTIVVFDRIRENFRKVRKGDTETIINLSLTQTLSRTIMTSLTVFLALISLFTLGGEMIHAFSLAFMIGGIVSGTYSSVYIAANVAVMMGVSREDLMLPEKEGAEIDSMP